jgi:LPXTG-motif cell wall-anchored protein
MTQQPPAWRKGSKKPASFTSDADFKDFLHVKVDDKVVDESNYDAKEGSTIITFKPKFLESLSVGNHSVEIVSASGSAYGNIEIKAESVQQTVEVTKSGDVLPKTGEGSGYYPWLALLLISAGGLILLTGKKRRSQQRD